jgi:hypothetical protein
LKARRPPGFPKVEIVVDKQRRRWPKLHWDLERRMRFLEAVENLLNDPELEAKCWAPMRAEKEPLLQLPKTIVVDCTGEDLCSTQP